MAGTDAPLLLDLSDQLADAVERGARGVVAVHARPRLASTGIQWRDGVVVTTSGTVRREQDLAVTLPSGRRVPATLAGRDPTTDLAVLRIATGELPAAQLGDATALRPGHLVLALARLDDSGPRAAFGAVSTTGGPWRSWLGGEIARLVQSDLELYPGFGGGPLIDARGQVLGVNSGRLSRPLTTTIPPETVERVLGHVLAQGYVPRGWLGAGMQPVELPKALRDALQLAQPVGLLVTSLVSDGPSATAGLLPGDIIVELDGRPMQEPEEVLAALTGDVVGRTLVLGVVRGGRRQAVDVLIGERPRGR